MHYLSVINQDIWRTIFLYDTNYKLLFTCTLLKDAVTSCSDQYQCGSMINYLQVTKRMVVHKLPSLMFLTSSRGIAWIRREMAAHDNNCYIYLLRYGDAYEEHYIQLLKYIRWDISIMRTCKYIQVASLAEDCNAICDLISEISDEFSESKLKELTDLLNTYIDYSATASREGTISYKCAELIRNHSNLNQQEDLLLAAVSVDPRAMLRAPLHLRDNKSFVLKALHFNAFVFPHISETLRDDDEVVTSAVSRKKVLMEHASERLRTS